MNKQWISTKQALPPEDIMCLCYCEDEPIAKFVIASYCKKYNVFCDYDEYPHNVTHWQKLPDV